MKLKYYLRGLGVGIILTMIITAFTSSGKEETLSDQEIMQRAAELGMIKEEAETSENKENNASPNDENLNVEDVKTDNVESNSSEKQPDTVPNKENNEDAQTDDKVPEKEQTTDQKPEPEESANNNDANRTEAVKIEVVSGEYSDTISQKLFTKQLVDDAKAFNQFLVESQFDERITVGVHNIPPGASYEDIAKILCGAPENP
jgi:outer membrane biosynthesis protein TonB